MKSLSVFFLLSLSSLPVTNAAKVRFLAPANEAFRCVVVGATPLAHTAQIMGGGSALHDQIRVTLANVNAALLTGGSSLPQAVKLNVYVTRRSLRSSRT